MKTTREKNQTYDKAQADKVRPALKPYDFKPLEAVIRQWITESN